MKKFFSLLFILFVEFNLFPQEVLISDSMELRNFDLLYLTGERYYDPGEKYIGIYFKDYWNPGIIILENGIQLNNLLLKYNISNNQLIMKDDKMGLINIDKQFIASFILIDNKKSYVFIKKNIETLFLNSDLFYQQIYIGQIQIFVNRNAKFNTTITKNDGLYYKYIQKPVYVLIISNEVFLFTKTTYKAIEDKFPDLKLKTGKDKFHFNKKIKTEDEFFKFFIENENILVKKIEF